jgi:hypothetical protein
MMSFSSFLQTMKQIGGGLEQDGLYYLSLPPTHLSAAAAVTPQKPRPQRGSDYWEWQQRRRWFMEFRLHKIIVEPPKSSYH